MLDSLGKLNPSVILYIVIIVILIMASISIKTENKAILATSEILSKGIRKKKIEKGSKEEMLEDLVTETRCSIVKLKNLREYYKFVTDNELIEYIIYREKAEEEKISYLIKKIKEIDEKEVI